MKVVKSKPHPILQQSVGKQTMTKSSTNSSSLSITEANNLAKLEKVDFHNLDNATDEFTELRMHLEGMNRKLSLTSGVLAKGNHIKAEKEVLEKMNSTNTTYDEEERDENDDNVEENKSLTDKISQEKELKQQPSEQEELFIERDNDNKQQKDHDVREVHRILSVLGQEEREVIYNYMLQSITHHTKRKVKENLLVLSNHCQCEFNQRRI